MWETGKKGFLFQQKNMGKEDDTVRLIVNRKRWGFGLTWKIWVYINVFLKAKKQVQIFTLFFFLVHLRLSLSWHLFLWCLAVHIWLNIHFYLGDGWEGSGIVLITCIVLFSIWRIEMYGYANQTVIWHSSTRMSNKCTYASTYSNSLCGGSVTKHVSRKNLSYLLSSLDASNYTELFCVCCRFPNAHRYFKPKPSWWVGVASTRMLGDYWLASYYSLCLPILTPSPTPPLSLSWCLVTSFFPPPPPPLFSILALLD